MIRPPPRSPLFPYTPLFRSLFAATFFVAFGLATDPADVLPVLPAALLLAAVTAATKVATGDRKSTRLNSSHANISYAVFCLKKQTASPHQGRCSPAPSVRRC